MANVCSFFVSGVLLLLIGCLSYFFFFSFFVYLPSGLGDYVCFNFSLVFDYNFIFSSVYYCLSGVCEIFWFYFGACYCAFCLLSAIVLLLELEFCPPSPPQE